MQCSKSSESYNLDLLNVQYWEVSSPHIAVNSNSDYVPGYLQRLRSIQRIDSNYK